MQGKTTLIAVDGTETVTIWADKLPLEFIQKSVGGWIEQVPYFDAFRGVFCIAMCNEEGKLNGLAVNRKANEHWVTNPGASGIADVLVGPVLIIQGDNEFIKAL